ncbi:MAG: filamentous hemagglutinin N-terminal domain-containing protein [Thermomonas sp.]|uniref:two-partner secretion domain-containing protein n=1 Tax=Thermomonas sp. TaxID=1971895 RepID=UPI001E11F0CA|nr:MBG domain-containing protein [Thermomonas sp.]MBZ0088351.1 filamentous hemagglutinin N-terminal domain-containing protein [Thermomonas sp.]
MSANISNRNNGKHRKQTQRRPRRGRLALALALALLAPAAWGGVVTPPTPQPVPACPLCLPEIGTVTSGAATSNLDLSGVMNPGPTGMDTLIITQTTDSAIINWNTFNVASGFAVYFDQPSTSSVTLNRVTGGNPSFIQGTINATGSVFLVNRAGILFGKDSVVNVGGLVASTLEISDSDFLAGTSAGATPGHYIFNAVGGFPGTPVVNQGTITADAGGTIALLAARIENQPGATLTAPEGSVVFGAAVGANLDFYNDGLTTVTLTGNGAASGCAVGIPTSSCLGGIENSGTITAAGGHVEMRTTTDDGLPQPIGTALFTEATNGGRIWIGGTVSTPTTALGPGSIILDAGMGNVDLGGISGQAGVVRANATGAGQNAGTVEIDAYQLFTHVCFTPGPPGNCSGVDNMGWIDATAQGAGGNGGQITINLTGDTYGGGLYHAGIIQAAAFGGNGGLVDINNPFGTSQIHNWILAESGSATGTGGTIDIESMNIDIYRGQRAWLGGPGTLMSQGVLSAYGYNNGGTVNLSANSISLISNGLAVVPSDPEYYWAINVRGMGGTGGTVNAMASGGSISVIVAPGSPVPWFVNASGYGAGGFVDFQSEFMQFDDTRFDVSGGVGSGTGNGGTIQLGATIINVNGTFLALGGAAGGNGGDISISGAIVNYGGFFDTRAATPDIWGTLFSEASVYLGVGGSPITVFAKDWSLYSGEVWVTTPLGFGSYSEGVVVTDAVLAAAMGNGTHVWLLADNLTYAGGTSFFGNVNFVDFASVNVTGTALGGASFTALNDILGNNFAITGANAALGLEFSAGGNIQLSNFSLDSYGGDIGLSAGDVLLNAGIIAAAGGEFYAGASGNGITINGASSVTASTITLFAPGTVGGIQIAGSTLTAAGGLELDANSSIAGITISGGSTLYSISGDIFLNADDSSSGGIQVLGGSMIDGGSIALQAERSYAGIMIDNSTVSGFTIELFAEASGGVEILGSTISAVGDYLRIEADNSTNGVLLDASTLSNPAGGIVVNANDSGTGIHITNTTSLTSYGDITLSADHGATGGIRVDNGSLIRSSNGDIVLQSMNSDTGIDIDDASIYATGGDISLLTDGSEGTGGEGIQITGNSYIDSDGGNVYMLARYTADGIFVDDSHVRAGGGDITLLADHSYGIWVYTGANVDAEGGAILLNADDSDFGITIDAAQVITSNAAITMTANFASAGGIQISNGALVDSNGGAVTLDADDSNAGLLVSGSTVSSDAGAMYLSALGTGGGISLVNGDLASTSGNIELAGYTASGAGVNLDAASSITAGSGTVVIRAGNDGSSDAIVLAGQVASNTAVNLRPLDATDTIYLGGGNGFVLDNAELANISSPWLVLGSAQHQGAIQVLSAITYGGNLTLQNQGGGNGILLDAMIDVSGHTLGLLTAGDVSQGATGAIHAESLLAVAGGSVFLNAAANDITGNTLSGSAGGSFLYLDANDLSIGNVAGQGFSNGAFVNVNGAGVNANTILIQNLTGNLTLNANVSGDDIDLVTAGVFLNPGGATITASNAWRVWASTWVGEDRGGLLGSGPLPNLYNCTYGGPCGVTVGSGNHFIYTQQPVLSISVDDVSREYGDSDPAFTYTVTGLIFADDNPLNVFSALLSSGTDVFSNVGTYAINGSFTSLAGYGFSYTPGTLTITPATLIFTADPWTWYMGMPFPSFTGTVTGFKNGDTVASYFGPGGIQWSTTAGPLSGPGYYQIYGSGSSGPGVMNYVFVQAPGNAQALHILPLAQPSDTPTQFISDPEETFVYETNFETVAMCPLTISGNENELAGGDPLGNEWSKVRKRLNLVNCFSNDRRNGCGSF